MKIESQDIDIERLFDGHFFNIPRFQRPYSWDADNIQDLWNDVTSSEGEDYFIGSMVVYREDKHLLNIVDGQQRLTTITLFLCAIRDELDKFDKDLAAGLHQLIERKNRVNKPQFVLGTETSFPYLQDKILGYGDQELDHLDPNPEEATLAAADTAIRKYISNAMQAIEQDPSIPDTDKFDYKLNKLVMLRDGLQNLKVILVELANEDDAYLIFETLNTRGKDLAVTDLLKNHFTKILKSQGEVDVTKEIWQKILNELHESSADLDSDAFLYHFWASRYEAIPLKKLYPAMKKDITPRTARLYLDEIKQDAFLYRAIHEPSVLGHDLKKVAASLSAIQLFRVSQPAPALLALLRAHATAVIKIPLLLRAVRAIEDFHFTFTAITSSRSSGGISGMFSSFARKLYNASSSNEAALIIKEFIDKLVARRPSQEEFEVAFGDVLFLNSFTKQKALVRYILRRFAEHEQFKFPVDWNDLTIEHFQPQSHIGKNGWDPRTVGQLGNLFYLDEETNGKIADKPPTKKREILNGMNYSYPITLSSDAEWTPESASEQTRHMAEIAYREIWTVRH